MAMFTFCVNQCGIDADAISMLQGTEAFCSGGDQALRTDNGYSDNGSFSSLNVLDLQVLIDFRFF